MGYIAPALAVIDKMLPPSAAVSPPSALLSPQASPSPIMGKPAALPMTPIPVYTDVSLPFCW